MSRQDLMSASLPFLCFFIFLLLIGPCQARAADPWTNGDVAREAVYQTLHFTDMFQTLYIARNPDGWHEHNPILGKHPNPGAVYLYFIGASAAHLGVSHVLPKPCREIWQYMTIGVEGTVVLKNFSIGAKWSW